MSQKRYGTHITNVDKHPGDVLKTSGDRKKRRTREEMAAALHQQEQEEKAASEKAARLRQQLEQMEDDLISAEAERLKPSIPLKRQAHPKTKSTSPVGATAGTKDALSVSSKGGHTGSTVSAPEATKSGLSGTGQDGVDVKMGVTEEGGEKEVEKKKGVRKRKATALDSSTGSAGTSKSAGGSKKFKAQFPSGLTASFAGNNSSSSKGLSAGAGQQKVPAHSGPIPDTAEPEDGVAFGGYVSSDTDEGLIGNSDSDASESTNQILVKIEPADTGLTVGHNPPISNLSTGSRTTKYTVKDILSYIPQNLQHKWVDSFIPELLSWAGAQNCPWNLVSINLPSAFKAIWRRVFPLLRTPPADPKTVLFNVACQKISEWRNGHSKHSDEVVERHFKVLGMGPKDIEAFVAYEAGRGVPCISVETTYVPEIDDYNRKGRWLGPLLLEVFAYHLKRIEGAAANPKTKRPRAALALSAVALERALGRWKSGKIMDSEPFCHRIWGRKTNDYMQSIDTLGDDEWDQVFQRARAISREESESVWPDEDNFRARI